MDSAEEWAKRLGTTVMTEEQVIQLRDRREYQGMKMTATELHGIDTMTPFEVDAYVAYRKARGEGLVGILPPYMGTDALTPKEGPHRHARHARHVSAHRPKVVLVLVYPDPHPELADPCAVTFTPEDAIDLVRKQHTYGFRIHPVGPITDIKAALMTEQEARALVEHGTPPGQLGTTPGALVCLVVIYGSFTVVGPPTLPRASRASRTKETAEIKPRPAYTVTFQAHDTRNGHLLWAGARGGTIVLPS
jgi:hypothetical protein